MKTPPLGHQSTTVWAEFDKWCTAHAVPDEEEDWMYLWDCYFAGCVTGITIGAEAQAAE